MLIESRFMTASWRSSHFKNKSSSIVYEQWQKKNIEEITTMQVSVCNLKLNKRNLEILVKRNSREFDEFDYSEKFDGMHINPKKNHGPGIYLYNLKMICGTGGMQTRSLKNVYDFIECQYKYNKKYPNKVRFVNILDGDASFSAMKYFNYLNNIYMMGFNGTFSCNDPINTNEIFIGSTHDFKELF
jgi:hypothetical protein